MDDLIDAAILSVAMPNWRKVALVIVKTQQHLELPDTNHDLIADRIRILVNKGQLLAQGNLTAWRFSEVRLPVEMP